MAYSRPYYPHEIDQHPDGDRIWATIHAMRGEQDFQDRINRMSDQIAAETRVGLLATLDEYMSRFRKEITP